MPVSTPHDEYRKYFPKWKRCRDVAAGQDAVHAAGVEYLPALRDQLPDEYEAYKKRAVFFNATWRTISGLNGMMFRKPPHILVPALTEQLLDDVTLSGMPFAMFAYKTVFEVLTTGRVGILVDYAEVEQIDQLTLADAQALNLRPTMAMYRAESIINWKTSNVNNRTTLTQVRLKEKYYEAKDEFTEVEKERIRVLDLVEGKYRVRIYVVDSLSRQEIIESEYFPLKNMQPLDFIPFYFVGAEENSPCCDEPPLIDLVDLNLSHYRSTADYEHGCHFAGLPTAVISGYNKEPGEQFFVGSATAWVFPEPTANARFLEFTGAGLTPLQQNLANKEARMAVLGARMLEGEKRAVETAEVASIHRSGETSLLAAIAQCISLAFKNALQTFSDWAGAAGEVEFDLNRDFFPVPLDSMQLSALVSGWQSGAYSFETLFANLQKREVIPQDRTVEEEQAKINDGMIATAQLNALLQPQQEEEEDPENPDDKGAAQ